MVCAYDFDVEITLTSLATFNLFISKQGFFFGGFTVDDNIVTERESKILFFKYRYNYWSADKKRWCNN